MFSVQYVLVLAAALSLRLLIILRDFDWYGENCVGNVEGNSGSWQGKGGTDASTNERT